jgi:hypothetical protein
MSRLRKSAGGKPTPVRTLLLGGGLSLLMVYIGLSFFLPIVSWSAGGGTHGTLLAQERECSDSDGSETCRWYGDFTGPSGRPTVHNVQVTNETGRDLHDGERVPGVYATAGIFLFPGRLSGTVFLGSPAARNLLSGAALGPIVLGAFGGVMFLLVLKTALGEARTLRNRSRAL